MTHDKLLERLWVAHNDNPSALLLDAIEALGTCIAYRVGDLIRDCDESGIVLTINLEPQQPLAMGNYVMRANYREARK